MKRFAACLALLFLAFAASAFDQKPYIYEVIVNEIANIMEAQLREYHFYAGKKLDSKNFSESELLKMIAVDTFNYCMGRCNQARTTPKNIYETKLLTKLAWDTMLYMAIRGDFIIRERR